MPPALGKFKNDQSLRLPGKSWGWSEGWSSGRYENEGAAQVVFLEVALKISGGVMARFFMLIPPMHKEAVGYAAEHPRDPQVSVAKSRSQPNKRPVKQAWWCGN
jgi:hypothetical protein